MDAAESFWVGNASWLCKTFETVVGEDMHLLIGAKVQSASEE